MSSARRTRLRRPTFASRLAEALRQLLVAALVLVAVGAAGWLYLLSRLDGEIRQAIETRVADKLVGSPLAVTIRAARRIEGRGIEVRGVVLRDRLRDSVIADIEEIFVDCTTDLQQLLNQQIEVRQVVVRHPRLNVERLRDGQWNVAALSSTSSSKKPMTLPRIAIEDGTIEIGDSRRPDAKPFVLRQISATLGEPTDEVLSRMKWTCESPPLHLHCESGGEFVEAIRADVLVDREALTSGDFAASASIDGVRFSSELLKVLPDDCADKLLPLGALEAKTKVTVDVRRGRRGAIDVTTTTTSATVTKKAAADDSVAQVADDEPAEITFQVAGQISQGRWQDERLATPLTELEADFRFDQDGGEVSRLSGRCGAATFVASMTCDGYTADSPLTLTARARRFELNRHWVQMLPAELRSHWEQFAPLGTFDADMTLAYDGARWKPEFTIEARDASFAYNKFPLRLTDARGKFTLRGGVLVMQNVVAHARGRPVRIDGRLANLGPDFTGYVKFDADQPIPVDQSLFEALPEQPRAIVTSLHPRGELTAHGKFERRVAGGPLEKSLDVEISSGSVQYDRFPYPVEKIAGRLRLRGERWDIVELTGHNDSAFIVCRGGWYQRPGAAAEFRIDFEATDVPLEDELKAALPPATQKIWSHANPRGTIDYVTVEVRQPPQGEKWSVNVVAQKRPATQNIDGRTLLVRPSWAPFPLDNVVGLIRYQDGRIAFEGVRAEHGRTSFQGRGVCDLFPNGRWRTHVEQVAIDRLTVDREMLVGLPAPWGQSLTKFNWNGPLNITGGLVINGSTRTNEPPTAQWDMTVDIENGSFHCGVPVEQIRGEVRLFGGGDPKSGAMQGELKLDSCLCRGVHVTQVRGPFWLTPPQVVFGDSWSQRRIADRPPRQVTAQVFGGMVATDAILALGDELGFRVQTSVQNVDLQLVAREALPQKRDIFGRGFASLALEGTSRGVHTWRGAGKVTCRDADIQQLPVMIALIKPLAARRVEAGQSFSLSDVDFQIQGDRVYFDRIDLKGEGMTLKGRGEMTFNRIVDLQFYTVMGRDDSRLPIIGPVLAEASRQIMEIRVTGPAEDPIVDRKVVPVINEALQQMFPELTPRASERPPLINRIPSPGSLMPRTTQRR